MCEPAYYCPNPECENVAFEPGLYSGCGSDLEPEEMVGTEESLEGWPCSAGFAPRVGPSHDWPMATPEQEELSREAATNLPHISKEEWENP